MDWFSRGSCLCLESSFWRSLKFVAFQSLLPFLQEVCRARDEMYQWRIIKSDGDIVEKVDNKF
jgi:hypothetical protein